MDELIVTMKAVGEYKTRDALFQAWVDTYEDDERRLQAMDLCRLCTEAVLEAAGKWGCGFLPCHMRCSLRS